MDADDQRCLYQGKVEARFGIHRTEAGSCKLGSLIARSSHTGILREARDSV